MKVYNKLKLKHDGVSKEILFGEPESKEEFEKMFSLRFNVYSAKKYFKDNFDGFKEKTDQDIYDLGGKCLYAIAVVDNDRVIGTVRLIRDKILPTELFFKFDTPQKIEEVPITDRGEVGRLVIQQYSESSFLPRNLILLFLLKTVLKIGRDAGVKGGYSFVKKGLLDKLAKLKVPIHIVREYIQSYPNDGILFNYFNQQDDPVSPTYFFTSEIEQYLDNVLNSKSKIIQRGEDEKTFVLNDSLYTRFLRRMKIL